MGSDGRLRQKTEAGWKIVDIPHPPEDIAVDEPAEDPDNPTRSAADFARMKLVPRIKSLRRALMLTQEEFAVRYRILVSTIQDWEEGRIEPDAPAKAYLHLIATDPEGWQISWRRGMN